MRLEREKISWNIGVGPEVTTEYAGTTLRAYYRDAEAKLYTQRMARERFRAMYGVCPIGFSADPPAYVGVAALGATLVYPEDHMPMVQGYLIHDPDQVEDVHIPEHYLEHPAMVPFVEIHRIMQEALGAEVPLGGGWEGPITSAKLLRGEAFFTDLYLRPEAAHRLLQIVTDSIIAFEREVRRFRDARLDGGIGLCDDFAGLISPEMFPEFVLPYWRQIYDAFGERPRSLHTELLRRDHLPLFSDLGLTHLNLGEDQYLTVRDVVESTDIPFSWNIRTVDHMLQGTPETIRRAYLQAVEEGAPAMTVDLCARGIPPANIQAYVEVAREMEDLSDTL